MDPSETTTPGEVAQPTGKPRRHVRPAVIGLVVETCCRFHRPLSFPGTVDAGLRVVKLGNSSVKYEIGLFAAGESEAAATGHFVHVWVDRATNRPTPVPTAIRAAVNPLLVSSA